MPFLQAGSLVAELMLNDIPTDLLEGEHLCSISDGTTCSTVHTKVLKVKATEGKEKVPRIQEEMRSLKEATGSLPREGKPLNHSRKAVYWSD